MLAPCMCRRRCCRRCFLRCTVAFLAVIIPLNFLFLKSQVEHLSGQVPWGSDFRDEQDVFRLNTGQNEPALEAYDESRRASFFHNIIQGVMSFLGVELAISDAEMSDIQRLWPDPTGADQDDRILRQIAWRLPRFPPDGVNPARLKVIYDKDGMVHKSLQGRRKFQLDKCPISTCYLTRVPPSNISLRHDAMIFRSAPQRKVVKQPGQVWVWFSLESPHHMGIPTNVRSLVNWTATYRRDSTLVAPYEKFVPFGNDSLGQQAAAPAAKRNYAKGKSKKVAWFVTNCKDQNGRMAYAKELQKYIDVDIYGACGPLKCPRKNSSACYEMLNKHYKFYLSFENSACVDYITEKLYWNALSNDIVPVVMGARREEYLATAPHGSFISVEDFRSPRELAEYLRMLDKNDEQYNSYFRWKHTGSFIDTKFWCRLCAMLHAADYTGQSTWYRDVMDWWAGGGAAHPGTKACIPRPPKNSNAWVTWSRGIRNATSKS